MRKQYPNLNDFQNLLLDALDDLNDHLLDLNMTLSEVVKHMPLTEEEQAEKDMWDCIDKHGYE